MKPYKRPYGGTPGPPVMYEKPSDPEDEAAGYDYSNAERIQEKDDQLSQRITTAEDETKTNY